MTKDDLDAVKDNLLLHIDDQAAWGVYADALADFGDIRMEAAIRKEIRLRFRPIGDSPRQPPREDPPATSVVLVGGGADGQRMNMQAPYMPRMVVRSGGTLRPGWSWREGGSPSPYDQHFRTEMYLLERMIVDRQIVIMYRHDGISLTEMFHRMVANYRPMGERDAERYERTRGMDGAW